MTYLDRYNSGETESVYGDIYNLEWSELDQDTKSTVEAVLTETHQRVLHNLEVIYLELLNRDYQFKTEFEYNFERPLHKPLPNTESLLEQLDAAVQPFGYVPESLKMFYKTVGGVNFGWDYNTNEDLMWNMADPIQIRSLDGLVSEVTDEYWRESMQECPDDEGRASLDISADDYHKDNISGGPAYSILLTTQPSVDSLLLNEQNNTTFIDYLRICFEHCGFPGIERPEYENDYDDFYTKLKPLLKKI